MRRQTYGYLPNHNASPPIGWYQIILIDGRGTCVLTTSWGLQSTVGRPGFELATCWSQVQHPNHSSHRATPNCVPKIWVTLGLRPLGGGVADLETRPSLTCYYAEIGRSKHFWDEDSLFSIHFCRASACWQHDTNAGFLSVWLSVQCCIEPWLLWITSRIRYPIDACHFLWPLKAARERSSFFLRVYVMLVPYDQQRLVSILPHVGKGLLKKCQLHTPSQGLCLATLQSLEPLPKPTPFHLERPNLVQYAQSV